MGPVCKRCSRGRLGNTRRLENMPDFYCENYKGEIVMTPKLMRILDSMTEEERIDLLGPEPCQKQCFDCMATVGERQLKTKQLINDKR